MQQNTHVQAILNQAVSLELEHCLRFAELQPAETEIASSLDIYLADETTRIFWWIITLLVGARRARILKAFYAGDTDTTISESMGIARGRVTTLRMEAEADLKRHGSLVRRAGKGEIGIIEILSIPTDDDFQLYAARLAERMGLSLPAAWHRRVEEHLRFVRFGLDEEDELEEYDA